MIASAKDFATVFRLQARQAFYHRKAAIATTLSWGLRVALTVFLYHGIYSLLGKGSVKSINFEVAISSMLFYAIFSSFAGRDVYRVINNEYKAGSIEIWLNKPISYLVLKMGENLGKNMPVVVGVSACSFLFWWFGNLPSLDDLHTRFIIGIILLAQGVIISYLLYALVGLCVIWLEDASPLYQIVDKIIMVFGGAYIPIGFFPESFRLIGETLPTGAVTLLSQIFYHDLYDNLPRFLATQLFWIVSLGFSLKKMNDAATLRLVVNGG